MKKILSLFIVLFILTSCGGKPESKDSENGKLTGQNQRGKPVTQNSFSIEVKNLDDFSNQGSIEKVGKIISNQTIEVSSQVSGRLKNIYVKEGQTVYAGQKIASLSDEYSKYYLDYQKAQIDYEKQIINKEGQIITLDKRIADTQLDLQDAQQNLENAKITTTEDRKKAEQDKNNTSIVDMNSAASLELEKARLDYNNTLESNQQQLQTYIENVGKEYNNLSLALGDVIKFSDEILGVTDNNKDKNDDFDTFLGAKDSNGKNQSEQKLGALIRYNLEGQKIDISNISEENILTTMDEFYNGYDQIKVFLQSIEGVMNNSISSVGALSEDDISVYISKINSFQSSNQNNLSSFTTTKNAVASFLSTYKNKELSAFKNVELQEVKLENSSVSSESNYNKTIATINSSLYGFESKVTQAQSSYQNAIDNQAITIKSLDNVIESAKNGMQQSNSQYAKLNIFSPIGGIIGSIYSDVGTTLSNGTKIATVVGSNNTQIEVSVNNKEIKEITVGDSVNISYQGENISGKVYSKSQVAGVNLEYRVIIRLSDKIDLIGGSTVVYFSNIQEGVSLPLNIITITESNKGFIYYFKDDTLKELELELGKINGDFVTIETDIPANIQIITSDMKRYNKATQTLTLKDTINIGNE